MNVVKTFCIVALAVFVGANVFAEEAAKEGKPEKGRGDRGKEHFAKNDTDGNGSLSLAEFTVAHEKRIAERKEKMGDKWDEERAAKRPGPEEMFKKIDKDADGALTQEEMGQAHRNRRRRKDGDGGKGKGKHKDGDKDIKKDKVEE